MSEDRLEMNENIIEMGVHFRQLKHAKAALEEQLKRINSEIDALRFTTIPEVFEKEMIERIRIAEVGTIYLQGDMHVSIVKNKDEGMDMTKDAHEWLRENGYGDIIIQYIHPSTLKALVKEQYRGGVTFPEELFKIKPFTEARLLK